MKRELLGSYSCTICNDAAHITVKSTRFNNCSYDIGLCEIHSIELTCLCCGESFEPDDREFLLVNTHGQNERPVCKKCVENGEVDECLVCDDLYLKSYMTTYTDDYGEDCPCCVDCKEEHDL